MNLIRDMQHSGLKLYKVCINGDPELTLVYFMKRSTLVVCAFEFEKNRLQSNEMGENL